MFSYIFMKVLESRPHRYDRGIKLLTGGHAARIKDDIVANYIQPDMVVLDVGCGTGSLAIKGAKAGARLTGLDISERMLAVARQQIKKNKLENKVVLNHAGVVEIDALFEENSFDLITSTLVISELYGEERKWALRELYRILKSDGKLLIVGEVKPKLPLKRALYYTMRFPLVLITYLISQTGTRAVTDISSEIRKAGFEIEEERYAFLGSLATIVAKKSKTIPASTDARTNTPEGDKSLIKSLFDFCGRWFPNPVEPGLRIIGTPDRNIPVIITANFHLTVRRVEKALKGQNCYLLVVPTRGINVWCAAAGGEMNTHSIITGLKTSRIGKRVDHKVLVLPQFAASGVDLKLLKKITGWEGKWGPASAGELPMFLANGYTKTHEQCLAHFPLSFRIEMLLSMNVLLWLIFLVIALSIHPAWALVTTLIFWGAGLILYAGYPFLPFKSGWLKALLISIVTIAVFIVISFYTTGNLWSYKGWMIFACLVILSIGFDLKGIVGDQTSEAETFMHKLGFDSFGHLFRAKGVHKGLITQDKSRCINCNTCRLVCPMGVYGFAKNEKDIIIVNRSLCLKCNACVMQCPNKVLSLN